MSDFNSPGHYLAKETTTLAVLYAVATVALIEGVSTGKMYQCRKTSSITEHRGKANDTPRDPSS